MAVRIRLTRVGATKRPAYRVVAIDRRRARDGRALEILGFYDPLSDPATVSLDAERITAWIGKGALPSDTVVKLMRQAGMPGVAPAPQSAPAVPKRAPRKPKAAKAAPKAATAQPAAAVGAVAAAAEPDGDVTPTPAAAETEARAASAATEAELPSAATEAEPPSATTEAPSAATEAAAEAASVPEEATAQEAAADATQAPEESEEEPGA